MFKIDRHEVPIAIRALKTANVYEIKGDDGILVDSGMSEDVLGILASQGVSFDRLSTVVLTHLHIDHVGSAYALQQKYGLQVAIGEEDANRVYQIKEDPEGFRDSLMSFMQLNGAPKGLISQIVGHHSVLDHLATYMKLEFDLKLKGNEEIIPGIRATPNPGHSPGSFSLYIKEMNSLFSGDHILPGITPNISFYDSTSYMLGLYLASLEETRKLSAENVFPGHRPPFQDANKRIDEILHHHDTRMKEILSLTGEWRSGYEVAESMKWSKNRSINGMNLMEMNFAIGEAISHLVHMERLGIVEKREFQGGVQYRSTE